MVLGFVSTTVSPPAVIFMGQHQEENEKLLQDGGYPEDIWFHVEGMSSAHVYLQLPRGMSIDSIPKDLLEDCCHLAKFNSIKGIKLEAANVMYTPRGNLKKTKIMVSGEVAFHNQNLVLTHKTFKKDAPGTLKRLNSTKWKSTKIKDTVS